MSQLKPKGNIYLVLFLILISITPRISFAQTGEGEADLSFNSQDLGYNNIAEGADNDVKTIAIQPDGKILIGGLFNNYSGQPANFITRINADGTKDPGFTGAGTNGAVTRILLQTDGKIIVTGTFTTYNTIAANGVIRLNQDGSLDASFNAGSGPNATLNAIAVQPDGKILIAGPFTNFNGADIGYLTRLNANGTLDISFNSTSDIIGNVNDLAVQVDGKILVALDNGIKRLTTAGITDATFNTGGGGADGLVKAIRVQVDGKILIGGDFGSYNGVVTSLTRLNTNGTIDAGFINNPNYANIKAISLQPDGKILTGWGVYTQSVEDDEGKKVARLNSDGSTDASFNYIFNNKINENIFAIQVQADGKVLIAETFISGHRHRGYISSGEIWGASRNFRIKRYNANGSVDELFGINLNATAANKTIRSLAVQPDNKIIIAGSFFSYDGQPVNYITRLNTDGSRDLSFNSGAVSANSQVNSVLLQPDGKIVIAGVFSSYNNSPANFVQRLNSNGTIDAGFNALANGIGAFVYATGLGLQPDGKILVGALDFTALVRLNTDGTKDNSFNTTFNNFTPYDIPYIGSITVQPDGKIIAGGHFDKMPGIIGFSNIARLNIDGSRDTSFNKVVPGVFVGANGTINVTVIQPDGKILVGGAFTSYTTKSKTTSTSHIMRLKQDGTIDETFNLYGSGANGNVNSIALQQDGKILIGGPFTVYNGITTGGLVRINADGTYDGSFNVNGPGVGGGSIYAVALQPDGKKIFIGGSFTSYDNIGRNRIARLRNCSPAKSTTNVTVCTNQLPYNWNGNSYNAAGTYSKTFNNPTGCDSIASLVLTVSASSISGPLRVCAYVGASALNATYSVDAPAGSSFTWSVTQPATMVIISGQGTNTAQFHFTDAFVSGNIYVSVKNVSCNYTIKPYIVVSKAVPSTPGAITAPPGTVCPYIGTGNSIRYSIRKVTGATSYNWAAQAGTTSISHPNGAGINDTTVMVTFAAGFTTSPITVQAVNDCGISTTRSLTITRSNPSAPGAISGPAYVCDYLDVPLQWQTATYSVPYVAGVVYVWSIPAGSINITGGNGSNTISFNFPANYTTGLISVTATNGCGASNVRSLSVRATIPTAPGVITPTETGSCPARTYTYSILAIPAGSDNVTWNVPTGASILSGQGTTSIVVSYPSTVVSGYVSIASKNSCGTSGLRKLAVSLPACPPATPFAKGEEITKTGFSATAVDGMDVKIFPNPSVSDFKLQVITSGKEEINVRIFEIQGRLLKEIKVAPFQTLNIGSELKAGAYMIEVRQGKNVKTTKVLKF